MTRNNIFSRLCDIDRSAQALIAQVGSGCSVCPDEVPLADPLTELLALLESLHEGLDHLKAPTHGEYPLERFPDGRYGYLDDCGVRHVLTCGSTIEAKITETHGRPRWVRTRMEHDGEDYFLWQLGHVPLEGLTIRERW